MASSFVFDVLSTQENADVKAAQLGQLGFTVTGPTKFDTGTTAYEEGGDLKAMTKHYFVNAWIVFGTKT
ncbi:MAG: hypothetical protein ABIO86_09605 [Sphingomonas sp.]